MLNTNINTNIKLGNNSQTVTFNSSSTGMIQKSHPKSKIMRFSIRSKMENMVFSCDEKPPHIHKYKYGDTEYEKYRDTNGMVEVEVLQMIIFGDNHYMVEVVEPRFLIEDEDD